MLRAKKNWFGRRQNHIPLKVKWPGPNRAMESENYKILSYSSFHSKAYVCT